MRPFLVSALNCLVRNEPGIPAATHVSSTRVRPARDVALVGIRSAQGKAIEFDPARNGEVKNVLVTVVQEAL